MKFVVRGWPLWPCGDVFIVNIAEFTVKTKTSPSQIFPDKFSGDSCVNLILNCSQLQSCPKIYFFKFFPGSTQPPMPQKWRSKWRKLSTSKVLKKSEEKIWTRIWENFNKKLTKFEQKCMRNFEHISEFKEIRTLQSYSQSYCATLWSFIGVTKSQTQRVYIFSSNETSMLKIIT